MTLWKDIIGHGWAVDMLSSAVVRERFVHAYLISGLSQVGKSTLALTFAQALNCEAPSPEERPCGHCRACLLIGAGKHPDVISIEGELGGRGKRALKIKQLREIQQALSLTATEGRYKVALIHNFNDANANAANAFLKTLEEPPAHAVVILTAVDSDLLLPTILSRCQQVALRPIPSEVIEGALQERWDVESDKAHSIARLADGRMGWAIQAVNEPALLERRTERLAILHDALLLDRVGRFDLASRLAKDPEELLVLLSTWLVWWRELALFFFGKQPDAIKDGNGDAERFRRLSVEWKSEEVIRSIRQTDEAIWQLGRNANTRLVVENLMLIYPYDSSGLNDR